MSTGRYPHAEWLAREQAAMRLRWKVKSLIELLHDPELEPFVTAMREHIQSNIDRRLRTDEANVSTLR